MLLVGNPTAQSGKARSYLDRAKASLEARGVPTRLIPTEPEGRTVPLITAAIEADAPDVVVYMGGDGTFNETARGILLSSRRPPLGMLPMGTANDQGRSYGLRPGASAIEANLDIILDGHVMHLDVGVVQALEPDGTVRDETHFFDCVGWGMQPEILARRNQDRARVGKIPILRELYRDQAVYAGAGLNRFLASFTEPTKFDAQIVCDGEPHDYVGLTDLVINNTPIYAGEWVPDRRARGDDGKMELVPMQGRRDAISKTLRDLKWLPLFQEDLDVIGVTHSEGFAGSSFELVFDRPGREALLTQLDGEEWIHGSRFRVTVEPNALPLLIRRDFKPPWRFWRE